VSVISLSSSDSSEQEDVIYGKNVMIAKNMSQPQKTSQSTEDLNKKSKHAKTHVLTSQNIYSLKRVQTFNDFSTNFEKLNVQKYIKEMENEKYSLQKKIDAYDKQLEKLGDKLANVANGGEVEKYKTNNRDVKKITALLFSIASRMAKYETYLQSEKYSGCEKCEIKKKQEKLKFQLSEAKALKTLVNKRTSLVAGYLERYFNKVTVEEFKNILSEQISSIVELKELEEKLCLSSR